MSFEESVLLDVMRAVIAVRLDVVLAGGIAAALHGVPVATQVIDIFISDTCENEEKIAQLARMLGPQLKCVRAFEPGARTIRVEGLPVDVDIRGELPSQVKFEVARSRATTMTVEGVPMRVLHLRDIIDSIQAAGRPRDLAILPLLEKLIGAKAVVEEKE